MSKKRNTSLEVSRRGGSAVITVKMEKHVEGTPVTRDSHQGWIRWGSRNDYPTRLADLYYNSTTHKDCVDFLSGAVLGDGVDYDAMSATEADMMPNYQYSWDDLIQRLALDMVLYGAYALQIIRNNDGKTYSFYHQPFSEVRCAPRDEDGVITKYFVCRDWTQTGLYKPLEIDRFGFTEDEEIKTGKPYLFVYEPYCPDVDYYPVPHYIAALKPIQTEIEIQRYDLRAVLNNFSATGILTLNRIDDEQDRRMMIENINAMFTGSDNANSLIINFKENDEDKACEFVKIDKDSNGSVNLFEQSNSRIVDKIIAAHRIASKGLVGYPIEGASLGGDGNTLAVAYNLTNKNIVQDMRRKILSTLNRALLMNGVETQFILKPLTFNIVTTSDTSGQTSGGTASTENDAEQGTENNNGNTD